MTQQKFKVVTFRLPLKTHKRARELGVNMSCVARKAIERYVSSLEVRE